MSFLLAKHYPASKVFLVIMKPLARIREHAIPGRTQKALCPLFLLTIHNKHICLCSIGIIVALTEAEIHGQDYTVCKSW
jgi:hypothetical protein